MESQTHSKGGRPSKYRPEYPDKLIEYFEGFLKEPFTKEVVSMTTTFYKLSKNKDGEEEGGNIKSKAETYKLVAKPVPTLFSFARSLDVNYATVNRWAEGRKGDAPADGTADKRPFIYPEFREAYKQAREYQKQYFLAVGMGGIAPSSFAIFAMKNMIGWRDAQESRLVDGLGNDVKMPGFIVLPSRMSEEQAAAGYDVPSEAGALPR